MSQRGEETIGITGIRDEALAPFMETATTAAREASVHADGWIPPLAHFCTVSDLDLFKGHEEALRGTQQIQGDERMPTWLTLACISFARNFSSGQLTCTEGHHGCRVRSFLEEVCGPKEKTLIRIGHELVTTVAYARSISKAIMPGGPVFAIFRVPRSEPPVIVAADISWYRPQTGVPRTCAHCRAPEAHDRCAGCETVHYCNRTCQRAHWTSGHRETCCK